MVMMPDNLCKWEAFTPFSFPFRWNISTNLGDQQCSSSEYYQQIESQIENVPMKFSHELVFGPKESWILMLIRLVSFVAAENTSNWTYDSAQVWML